MSKLHHLDHFLGKIIKSTLKVYFVTVFFLHYVQYLPLDCLQSLILLSYLTLLFDQSKEVLWYVVIDFKC